MTIFDNPFYLLDATVYDDRKKLQTLYARKNLLGDEALFENALQILTNPAKRLFAELRWFPGCDDSREIMSSLKLYRIKKSSFYKEFISLIYDGIDIPVINILLTLLPEIDYDNLCEIIRGISSIQSNICPQILLGTINRTRSKAGFPHVNDVNLIKNELISYNTEVSMTVLKKLRTLTISQYHDLVVNLASDSSGELPDDILYDYALTVTPQIQIILDDIKDNAYVVRHTLIKSEHKKELDKIKQLCTEWCYYMLPLREHVIATGSQSIAKEKEDSLISLLDDTAQALKKQQALQEALFFWELLYYITPDAGNYKNLRESISKVLEAFKSVQEERDASRTEEYRKASIKAWEEEKAQYDKEARLRSVEAAEKEKERIRQNNIEKNRQLSQQMWEKEQKKYDEEARLRSIEAAEKEKERIRQNNIEKNKQMSQQIWEKEQKKKVEEARLRSIEATQKEQQQRMRQENVMLKNRLALLTQKESLRAKRKELGIFSGKEKEKIDNAIADIDRKLSKI